MRAWEKRLRNFRNFRNLFNFWYNYHLIVKNYYAQNSESVQKNRIFKKDYFNI